MEEGDENDFIDDDDRPALQKDAGIFTARGFEPDDKWLLNAHWRLQHEAMRL